MTSCRIQSQLHLPMGEFTSHLINHIVAYRWFKAASTNYSYNLTHTLTHVSGWAPARWYRQTDHWAIMLPWTRCSELAMSYRRGDTLRRTVNTQSAGVECFQCSFAHGAQKMLTVQQMLKKLRWILLWHYPNKHQRLCTVPISCSHIC